MTEPSKAVFLSYASQDAEAARQICEALRAAGIEVWFDQNELRGGDAWDRQITKQIRECALFVALISTNTDSRDEGYFRREWRVAVDRTRDLADDKAFLLPVVIDGMPDATARVPDKFREVQWSRLQEGAVSPAFVERVSRLLSASQAPAPTPPHPSTNAAPTHRQPGPSAGRSRRTQSVLLVIAAVAVIAGGYFAVEHFGRSKRPATPMAESSTTAKPVQSAIPEKSIAVLPFVNMSSDKEQEYFSDGLTEEMIDLLGQVQDLRVPARTSSFSFKGKSDDIPTIAQKLRVAHVLEGSVRKAGKLIRVTVQLIRADSGYHLWSKTYDRDIKDIFKVQDEIAAAVVEALKVKLGPTQPVASRRMSNTEAYNQYLLGRQFYNRGDLDGWRRAIEAFHKAIALDPSYTAAYAGLAYAEWNIADEVGDAAAVKRAETSADKAVALGPDQADGYAARGFLRTKNDWDWTGAQADFAKALALDPAHSRTQLGYGATLDALGRTPEAIVAMRKATEIDPLWGYTWSQLGKQLTIGRDFAGAHEALRRALEVEPGYPLALYNLGRLQLLEGKAAEALVTFRKQDEFGRLFGVSMAEHTLGHAKESQQALDELIAKHARVAAFQIGEVYAWRGDKDKAFEWLERAFQQRDSGLAGLKTDMLLASVRGDPRIKALLRKMKLPE